ncbi:serine hydrolase domain-containing protein [Kutzneria chonburiensis]|uniref:Serine hydrolase domain-containing protein n=1 Tax=Kutzneria chonburiensis TaxID=1483604 RepID=A0ABV6N5I2_9PSEU|nr:serine hydrolase domain-containing protein [Kutzneria chonburiensis]
MGWSLGELIARHDVPGAQVAVLADGRIEDDAAGVLSRHTRVEATTDSIFKIGSITKLWTATLVQQLMDEGLLELDRPVSDYRPGLGKFTVRQLLTHTSGMDANHFVDTGRGDDAIEKFVDTLADVDHPFPPGTVFSYSNSGFATLGRLVEVLRGQRFHDVLRERIATPLGLRTVAVDPYEAILHRAAVGHFDGGEPTTSWAVRYHCTPSGSHLAISARELLEFVRMHLTDPNLAALRETQLDEVPDFGGGQVGWGLGWMRYRDGIVGHTGVSKGQKAFLRVAPSAGVAVAVLTNSAGGAPLAYEIFAQVLHDLTGVETDPLPVPPANPTPIDVERMGGTYRTTLHDITLAVENGRTFLTYRPRNGKPENRVEVVRLTDKAVITVEPTFDGHQVLSLIGDDGNGRAQFLHNGSAAYRIA